MNKMKKLRLNPEQRDRLDNAAAMFGRALKDPVLSATNCALWWQDNIDRNPLYDKHKIGRSLIFNRMILKIVQETRKDSEISKEDRLDLKAFQQELLKEIREQKLQLKNIQRAEKGRCGAIMSANDREGLKRQYVEYAADRLQEEPSPRDIERREAYAKKVLVK